MLLEIDRRTGQTLLVAELQPGGAWLITEVLPAGAEPVYRIDPRTGRWART